MRNQLVKLCNLHDLLDDYRLDGEYSSPLQREEGSGHAATVDLSQRNSTVRQQDMDIC